MSRKLLVAAFTTALLLIPGVALAAFRSTTSAQSMTLSALAISPVTNLQATASCGPPLSLKAKVVLTWTATTTTRATSYEIRRRIIPLVATAVGTQSIGTNTYTDNTLAVGTTFGYVVRTYVGSWFADSSEVQVTTPAVCT
jgi:hypothetical protein